MRKTIKLIISTIIISVISCLFKVNTVNAVGMLNAAWVENNTLMFRNYVTPYPSTYNAYKGYKGTETVKIAGKTAQFTYNNETYTSTWKYAKENGGFSSGPSVKYYVTIGYNFHKNPLGKYDVAKYECKDDDGNCYKYGNYDGKIEKDLPGNIFGNIADPSAKMLGSKFGTTGEKIVHTIMNTTYKSTGNFSDGLIYRMALVPPAPKTPGAIYVTDRIMTSSQVSSLKNSVSKANAWFTYGEIKNCIRISNILLLKNYNGGYDELPTAKSFAYALNSTGRWFTNESRGTSGEAMGSVLNLYDNILAFPSDYKQTVSVRHVNIGENDQITTTNVNDGTKTPYLKLENDSTVSKSDEYGTYIGYNYSIKTSESAAQAAIAAQVISSPKPQYKATSFKAPANTTDADRYVVVEMYYRDSKTESSGVKYLSYNWDGTFNKTLGSKIGPTLKEDANSIYAVQKTEYISGREYIGAIAISGERPTSEGPFGENGASTITMNMTNSNGYVAFRELKPITIMYVEYDGDGNYVGEIQREEIKVGKNTSIDKAAKPYSAKSYKGVATGTSETPLDNISMYSSTSSSISVNARGGYNYVYFAYQNKSQKAYVRHLLYNADGEYEKTLESSTLSIESGSSATAYKGMYSEYLGYIKTNNKAIPSIMVYNSAKSCTVAYDEIATDNMFINFIYQYDSITEEELDEPEKIIEGNLHVSSNGTVNTTNCLLNETNSIFYKENLRILSIAAGESLKFSVDDVPDFIVGGIKTEKQPGTISQATFSVKINNYATAYGTYKGESKSVRTSLASTKTITFVIPYKTQSYAVNSSKIYRATSSNLYNTASGNADTIGEKLLPNAKYAKSIDEISSAVFKVQNNSDTASISEFVVNGLTYSGSEISCNDNVYVSSCSNMINASYNQTSGSTGLASLFALLGGSSGADITVDVNSHAYMKANQEPAIDANYGLVNKETNGIFKVNGKYYSVIGTNQPVGTISQIGLICTYDSIIKHQTSTKNNADADAAKILARLPAEKAAYEAAYNQYLADGLETSYDEYYRLFEKHNNSVTEYNDKLAESTNAAEKIQASETYKATAINTLKGIYYIGWLTGLSSQTKDLMALNENVLFYMMVEATSGSSILKLNNIDIAACGTKYSKVKIDSTNFATDGSGQFVIDMQRPKLVMYNSAKEYYKTGFNLVDIDITSNIETSETILNGTRAVAADISYTPTTGTIKDNLYYSNISNNKVNYVFTSSNSLLKNKYNNEKKNIDIVNVYTPVNVSAGNFENEDTITDQPISQLEGQIENADTSTLTPENGFHIKLESKTEYNGKYPSSLGSSIYKYLKKYYLKFDFDVKELTATTVDGTNITVQISGRDYNGKRIIPADTWIVINTKDSVIIRAKSIQQLDGDISYTVRALAKNITGEYETASTLMSTSEFFSAYNNICNDDSSTDRNRYYDEVTKSTKVKNIDKLYDFEVTDVKDVSWKSVFRQNNNHNGTIYHSGTKKWLKDSGMSSRTTIELGKNPTRVLPIGPYKHTDLSYSKAPKIGYRISFDVKLTGEYDENRNVYIEPSFYYISKEGNIDSSGYTDSDKFITDVDLYYKNSSGKYVKIGSNADNYKLTFTPNDGYRYLDSGEKTNLATTLQSLGTLSKLTLVAKTMTTDNTGDHQTYYGEYKLPNSTIAVEQGKDITNEKNILKNGYVGVVFNIKSSTKMSGKYHTISYGINMNKGSTTNTTTQWDYEKFLGQTYGASSNTTYIKLEKGKWLISPAIYEDIKGTVVLYDLDQRADNDYN